MPIRWIRGLLLTGLFVGACFEIYASNFETDSIAVQQAPTPKQECLVSKPVDVERHGLKPWYINTDQTIWAYFWTSEPLKASPRDYKVLWIRPKPFPMLRIRMQTECSQVGKLVPSSLCQDVGLTPIP